MQIGKVIAAPQALSPWELARFFGGGLVLLGAVAIFWDRAWGFLRSLRFAIVLILFLLIASILGVLLKQRSTMIPEQPYSEDWPKIQQELQRRFEKERKSLAAIPDDRLRAAEEHALRTRIQRELEKKYGDLQFRDTFIRAEVFFLWNLWHKGFNIFGNRVEMDARYRKEYDRRKRVFGKRAASDWWDMARIGINTRRTEAAVDAMAKEWREPMGKVFAVAEALDFTSIWKSDWFAMLFLLIFYQVSANLMRASVWKWSRSGFLLSHGSIAVMLIGCALSRKTDIRGFIDLDLHQKRATAFYTRYPKDGKEEYSPYREGVPLEDDLVLRLRNFKADPHKRLLVTAFDEDGPLQKQFKTYQGQDIPLFRSEKGGKPEYRIVIEDFQPRVRPKWWRVSDPKAPFDPILRLGFSVRRGGRTLPLTDQEIHAYEEGKEPGVTYPFSGMPGLKLAYLHPRTPREERAWKEMAGGPSYGDLVLGADPRGGGIRFPIGPDLGDLRLTHRGKAYRIVVLEVLPDYARSGIRSLAERARKLAAKEEGKPPEVDGRRASLERFETVPPGNPAVLVRIDRFDGEGSVEAEEIRLLFADPKQNNDGRGFPAGVKAGEGDPHAGLRESGEVPELPLSFAFDFLRCPSKRTLLFLGEGEGFGYVEVRGGKILPFRTWEEGEGIVLRSSETSGEKLEVVLSEAKTWMRSRMEAEYEALPEEDFFHRDPAGLKLRIEGPQGTKRVTLISSTIYAEMGETEPIPPEVREFHYDERLQVRFHEDRRMLPLDWKSDLELHRVRELKLLCSDKKTLVVPVSTEKDWKAFQDAWKRLMDRMGAKRDFPAVQDLYATPDSRLANLESLYGLFQPMFKLLPSTTWLQAFEGSRAAPLDRWLEEHGKKPLARMAIRVNDPLVYGGFFRHYRFTQSDAKSERPFYTGIGVQNDAGVTLVVLSMYALGIGTILMFLLQPWLKGRRRERARIQAEAA